MYTTSQMADFFFESQTRWRARGARGGEAELTKIYLLWLAMQGALPGQLGVKEPRIKDAVGPAPS